MPQVGKTYEIRHSRKGTFIGVVKEISGEWADVEITNGIAKAVMDYNVREAGETIRVRDSMTYWTELD